MADTVMNKLLKSDLRNYEALAVFVAAWVAKIVVQFYEST